MPDTTKSAATTEITTDTTATTTPAAETTTVGFAITVLLGDPAHEVTITAPSMADVAKNGMYFALPQGATVTLGSLKKLISWLNNKLKAAGLEMTIPTNADGWPDPLDKIFNGILNTQVSVNRFAVAQDPTPEGGTAPPLRFDLEVTGVAMNEDASKAEPIDIFGIFSVVGGGVALTRSYENAPTTWTAVSSGTTQKELTETASV